MFVSHVELPEKRNGNKKDKNKVFIIGSKLDG
jgi:hypothetical protein